MPCPLVKKEVLLSQEKQLYILYNTVHLPMSIQTTYIKVISISECKVNILVECFSEGVKTSSLNLSLPTVEFVQ